MDNDFFNGGGFDKSSNLENVTSKFFTSSRDLNSILFGIQYNTVYLILGIVFGSVLNLIFPVYNAKKSMVVISFEVLFQTIITSLMIHYIKKLSNKIPFYLGNENNVDKRVGMDIIVSIAFIASQINLLKKIQHLSKKSINWVSSKMRTNKTVKTNKKQEIKNIVKQILKNKSQSQEKSNQVNQTNQIKQITQQIEEAKKYKTIAQQNNYNNNTQSQFVPMPMSSNQNSGSYGNALQSHNVENFSSFDVMKPLNSMDQNSSLNGSFNDYRSNMTAHDYNNMSF